MGEGEGPLDKEARGDPSAADRGLWILHKSLPIGASVSPPSPWRKRRADEMILGAPLAQAPGLVWGAGLGLPAHLGFQGCLTCASCASSP